MRDEVRVLKMVKTLNWIGLVYEVNERVCITSGARQWEYTQDRASKTVDVEYNKNEAIKIIDRLIGRYSNCPEWQKELRSQILSTN